jgi:hypothetical protein
VAPLAAASWLVQDPALSARLTLGIALVFASCLTADAAAAQLLLSMLIRGPAGNEGAEDDAPPRGPTLSEDLDAETGLRLGVLALKNARRFPNRIVQRLRRRPQRTFWSHEELAKRNRLEVAKGAAFSLGQLLLTAVALSVVAGAVMATAATGSERLIPQLAGAAMLSLLSAAAYVGWRLRPSRCCVVCTKPAADVQHIGAFSFKLCSDECRRRASGFWSGWAKDLGAGFLTRLFEFDDGPFMRMIREAARQMREWSVVLHR